jgi:lactate dehydrogenase-like 2-hydroxyacid dehydrogenase
VASGAGIEAVLSTGLERLDATRLASLPHLRLIAVIAAGTSNVDLEVARARGIMVTNAGDLNASDVADYGVAMTLAMARDVMANDRFVRNGQWGVARSKPGRAMSAQRVGIVGLGNIGIRVAERITPFGCAIAWWGPNARDETRWPRRETLLRLATWATILIVTVRGDERTAGLISPAILDALGKDGILVNVSRGFVIDEAALKERLRTGDLAGAALDVFEKEPHDGSQWQDIPNVLMAPHTAAATQESFEATAQSALDNIRRYFGGLPLQRRVI